MKGKDNQQKKKKGYRFGPGNQFSPKKKKLEVGECSASGPSSAVDSHLNDVDPNLEDMELLEPLGPQTRTSTADRGREYANRLLHLRKTLDMINDINDEHNSLASKLKCSKQKLDVNQEVQWGTGIRLSLRCVNCDYKSKLYKLYNEVEDESGKGGQKAAAANKAIHVALFGTTIFNAKAREVFNAIDLKPPNKSGMDKMASKVSHEQEKVAKAGIKSKLALVTENHEKPVKVSADCRYDTCRIGSSRRTGEPLTKQGVTFVVEHNSPNKYVVGQDIQNKACRKCDPTDEAPGGHDNCEANVHRFEPISERRAGANIGDFFNDEKVVVSHLTTDGDGRFFAGLQSKAPNVVIRQSDPIHLGQTIIRNARKVEWSDGLFPDVQLKADKDKCKNSLAIDIKNRSMAILKGLHHKYRHLKGEEEKMKKIKTELSKSVEGSINCYKGICDSCSKYSTACEGGVASNNWIKKSIFLQEHQIDFLQPNTSDEAKMRQLFETVLSAEGVDKLRDMTNTQLNEALNRSLSSHLPKNITTTKTLRGRVSQCTEKHNYGKGKAVARIYKHLGVPISEGQKAYLRKQQQQHQRQKAYTKNKVNRARRYSVDARTKMQRRSHATKEHCGYSKGHLDHQPDHPYQVRHYLFYNILSKKNK